MRIKLNRGPAKGKIQDFSDDKADTIVWQENLPIDWRNYDPLSTEVSVRRGTYRRSNVTLKNGTVVFEWMGWLNG